MSAHEQEEEQLRAAYEEELSRISATDLIAQSTVSLLNIGARRLVPAQAAAGGEGAEASTAAGQERDLEQARDAIDAVRALLEILDRRIPGELGALREALSHLQVTYARAVSEQDTAGAGAQQRAGETSGGGGEGPGGGGQDGTERSDEGGGGQGGAGGGGPDGGGQAGGKPTQRRPGPAESSGRLWVPGG